MAERASQAVLHEAISWSVRLNSGRADEAMREACRRWRQASAEHERVWRQLQAIEDDLGAVAAPPAAGALRAAPALSRRRVLAMLGAGAAGAGLAGALHDDAWRRWGADFRTAVGERRQYALAGGARLWLDTDTAVNQAAMRDLTLMAGEMLLDTGAAGGAPWTVRSREASFTAHAARFALRQLDGATSLSVQRGSLRVEPRLGAAGEAQAGGRYLVSDRAMDTAPAVADAGAWVEGVLAVRGMRLGDFVAELARYQRGWTHCDPVVAALRVSGVFQLDDVPAALDTLAHALPVRVTRYTRYLTRVVAA
ncbi:hypothetical protein JL37_17955 [Achromobacter sp. RTa]|uniref:FecR domain-containing protein n=1 Tax=Achromobacter sp. RTa TaxID=1532557 RepID=UPI00050F09A1|nr:FecR domain-containing protein [Achromobacter sp. RTa]KGD89860.1 hypothetical protein JL37_17955 [Achromobacter sp. RTa]